MVHARARYTRNAKTRRRTITVCICNRLASAISAECFTASEFAFRARATKSSTAYRRSTTVYPVYYALQVAEKLQPRERTFLQLCRALPDARRLRHVGSRTSVLECFPLGFLSYATGPPVSPRESSRREQGSCETCRSFIFQLSSSPTANRNPLRVSLSKQNRKIRSVRRIMLHRFAYATTFRNDR